jgi:hypothetical protein
VGAGWLRSGPPVRKSRRRCAGVRTGFAVELNAKANGRRFRAGEIAVLKK